MPSRSKRTCHRHGRMLDMLVSWTSRLGTQGNRHVDIHGICIQPYLWILCVKCFVCIIYVPPNARYAYKLEHLSFSFSFPGITQSHELPSFFPAKYTGIARASLYPWIVCAVTSRRGSIQVSHPSIYLYIHEKPHRHTHTHTSSVSSKMLMFILYLNLDGKLKNSCNNSMHTYIYIYICNNCWYGYTNNINNNFKYKSLPFPPPSP